MFSVGSPRGKVRFAVLGKGIEREEEEQIGSSMFTVSCVLFTSGRQVTIRAKRPRGWKYSSFTRSRKVLILKVVIR